MNIRDILPASQIKMSLIDIHAFARDAGFYNLTPQIVLQAKSVEEIADIFKFASTANRKIVFRAAGTSLSGQSITDDILVEVKQGWKDFKVLENGLAIKMEAGVIGARANLALTKYGTRIGPDPGTINAAFIAGIVANNASGIGSGIKFNSYMTLQSMELVLTNGIVLDSGSPHADEEFKIKAPEIYSELLNIRDTILDSEELVQLIRHKYRLKNTSGYSINSFLDHEAPIDILAHLMVGSEGTLGFISSVTLNTVRLLSEKATALIFFHSLQDAATYVPKLKDIGAYALEIMDDSALRALQHIKGLPEVIYSVLPDGIAALLLEFQSDDVSNLDQMVQDAELLFKKTNLYHPLIFTKNPSERERLWSVRRELGPLHAANRPQGTTVLSEDVCFEKKDLANAISDLQTLNQEFGYHDAIIFGHAGDGNLHFKLSIDFEKSGAVSNYEQFMDRLVSLVVDKYSGSLKAEHGTGRNMAPFLEKEWGGDAFEIMHRIKNILDPQGILNPDVVLSDDKRIHLKNIKILPKVHSLVDPCIECGLCEPWCPSGNLTLSPRQRIGVLREMEVLKSGSPAERKKAVTLKNEFNYSGVQTCATDGLCSVGCPVNIDTGKLMKIHRQEAFSSTSIKLSLFIQKHYAAALHLVRISFKLFAPLLQIGIVRRMTKVFPKWSSHLLPHVNDYMSVAAVGLPKIQKVERPTLSAVYMPSCINRLFDDPKVKSDRQDTAVRSILNIFQSAGIQAIYPQNVDQLCCGLTFSSKGLNDAAEKAAIQTTEVLWLASDHGRIPIVMDTSPCSLQMKNYDQVLTSNHLDHWQNLTIFDISEYLHDTVIPRLNISPVSGEAVLHPTCSMVKMGLEKKMLNIAQTCADQAVIPEDTGCCGFAGDRGMFFPELTENATLVEAESIAKCRGDAGYYSTSRTCEMGMSQASGQHYSSLVHLVEAAIQKGDTSCE
jgi:D-lactate dehydrogenase